MPEAPFITVVVPVRNEERFIEGTLLQLVGQDYPGDRFEVIVADGMSDDRTPAIVRAVSLDHPNVRLIPNEKRLSSAGRNVGFRHGKGDYFVVVDGHCYIEGNRWLRNVADGFEKSGADCLGRPQPLDPPGLSTFQTAVALARASWIGHGGDSLIYSDYEGFASPVSNGAAYRRSVFEKVGYVDERFDACEDVEFNYRVEQAGMKAYTSPRFRVLYYPRDCLAGLFRQLSRYGRGRWKLFRKHPETFGIHLMVPPGFLVGFALLAISGIFAASLGKEAAMGIPYVLFLVCATVYAGYTIVLVAESIRVCARHGHAHFPYLLLIFPVIHSALGWGFLSESLASRG